MRLLAEGARPTLELLADASGRSLRLLQRDAARQRWRLAQAPLHDVLARIQVVARMQLERLEALGRAALENGGAIDKAEVDGIIALSRSLEKIGDIMRPEDAAKENQIARDDQLADILQCINDRIVELAREFAQDLRANEAGLARGPPGGRASGSLARAGSSIRCSTGSRRPGW